MNADEHGFNKENRNPCDLCSSVYFQEEFLKAWKPNNFFLSST